MYHGRIERISGIFKDRIKSCDIWIPPIGARVLRLTLSQEPFEVMVTGEKDVEYRKDSEWIRSRLFHNDMPRKYDFVHFTNGYGADKPFFVARFVEFAGIINGAPLIKYSNGLEISEMDYDWCIYLGEIVAKGNLK